MKQLFIFLSVIYLTATLFTWSSAHIFEMTSTLSLIILWNVYSMAVTAIILLGAYYINREGHDISLQNRANTLQRG